MYLFGKISVTTVIPEKLKMLDEISQNLWWSWNPDAIDLYREIDLPLWEKLNKNPVKFLHEVGQDKLNQKLEDEEYVARFEKVVEKYKNYMGSTETYFSKKYPDKTNHCIAYFSAEYGLNEVLPIYSGGLGVLSGDHCKSASDLGLPFVAIGLFYKQGYFSQHINRDGWQETHFSDLNEFNLPISPATNKNGEQIVIAVELPGRITYAKIWQIKIGRVKLYLMDTDIAQNSAQDRWITARLYGGDQETRIQQEMFLGIGGIKVLEALDITPTVYHMNEGHSSFLGLELIRKLMVERNLSFKEAKEIVSSCTVFTTHTPVPAGNDAFPLPLIDKYFSNFWGSLGINRHEFLDLGLKVSNHNNFNMTVLALSIAGRKNGVSELHGAVSRNIFKNAWPQVPEDEVPIKHITNGIHTKTWMSPLISNLMDKYVGQNWHDKMHKEETLEKIDSIPDEELWNVHCQLKNKMIHWIRERLKDQKMSNNESLERVSEVNSLLDPTAFTIGFARRFATYKRANLIFRNIARIQNILNMPDMPMQIIFAGKAHPADRPAHEIIKHINDIANQEGFRGKVILVENYNMTLARNLVQGVDVWLNNPRRPLEASGTSGQKVAINGILNFSVLDGWWCEGYNGKNGWSIGKNKTYENEYYQDNADSESIYDTLENEILPLYFKRNEKGIPVDWVRMMKESMKSILFKFSTHRMVEDYFKLMYLPCMERMETIEKSNFKFIKDLCDWKGKLERAWNAVTVNPEKKSSVLEDHHAFSGDVIRVSTEVYLDSLSPNEVSVEVYYGVLKHAGVLENPHAKEMMLVENLGSNNYKYSSEISITNGGEYGYTYRIIPRNPDLIDVFDLGLIKWIV